MKPYPDQPVIGVGQLPRDLSPWSMFMSADILVQAVMIGLAFASVVTWTVWLAKNIELWAAMRFIRSAPGTHNASACTCDDPLSRSQVFLMCKEKGTAWAVPLREAKKGRISALSLM